MLQLLDKLSSAPSNRSPQTVGFGARRGAKYRNQPVAVTSHLAPLHVPRTDKSMEQEYETPQQEQFILPCRSSLPAGDTAMAYSPFQLRIHCFSCWMLLLPADFRGGPRVSTNNLAFRLWEPPECFFLMRMWDLYKSRPINNSWVSNERQMSGYNHP